MSHVTSTEYVDEQQEQSRETPPIPMDMSSSVEVQMSHFDRESMDMFVRTRERSLTSNPLHDDKKDEDSGKDSDDGEDQGDDRFHDAEDDGSTFGKRHVDVPVDVVVDERLEAQNQQQRQSSLKQQRHSQKRERRGVSCRDDGGGGGSGGDGGDDGNDDEEDEERGTIRHSHERKRTMREHPNVRRFLLFAGIAPPPTSDSPWMICRVLWPLLVVVGLIIVSYWIQYGIRHGTILSVVVVDIPTFLAFATTLSCYVWLWPKARELISKLTPTYTQPLKLIYPNSTLAFLAHQWTTTPSRRGH